MPEGIQKEYQEILHQLHADVFLRRLEDHLDPDGRTDFLESDASDLNDLARRLQVRDASPSIEREDIEKLLVDDEIRDQLKQSIHHLIKSQ